MIKAILLMAGSGKRFESETPKQYHLLSGKRVYLHTLERFLEIPQLDEILLVCETSWSEEVKRETSGYSQVRVVDGGATRQESAYLGLLAAGPMTNYVVIHDAVRPFVTKEIIQANIEAAKQWGAVDTCISSSDTLVYAPNGRRLVSIPKRADYLRGQTPQSFSYPLILQAHEEAKKRKQLDHLDDCSLALAIQAEVSIVRGEEENFKITTPFDLKVAEALLNSPVING